MTNNTGSICIRNGEMIHDLTAAFNSVQKFPYPLKPSIGATVRGYVNQLNISNARVKMQNAHNYLE